MQALGAEPIIAHGLDSAVVMKAVLRTRPEVVIHEMTGLIGVTSLKDFDSEFALTNCLRIEGTDNLLDAAKSAGVRRFIAQSYGNRNYEHSGTQLKTEEDSFDLNLPAKQK